MRSRPLSFYCAGEDPICLNRLFLLIVYRGNGSSGFKIRESSILSFYRILFRYLLELEDAWLLRKIVRGSIWNSFLSISLRARAGLNCYIFSVGKI